MKPSKKSSKIVSHNVIGWVIVKEKNAIQVIDAIELSQKLRIRKVKQS